MLTAASNLCAREVPVSADTIFIVQRRNGDVMISPFAGPNRPEEATQEVAEQVGVAGFDHTTDLVA